MSKDLKLALAAAKLSGTELIAGKTAADVYGEMEKSPDYATKDFSSVFKMLSRASTAVCGTFSFPVTHSCTSDCDRPLTVQMHYPAIYLDTSTSALQGRLRKLEQHSGRPTKDHLADLALVEELVVLFSFRNVRRLLDEAFERAFLDQLPQEIETLFVQVDDGRPAELEAARLSVWPDDERVRT